jgi:hypothetical protein
MEACLPWELSVRLGDIYRVFRIALLEIFSSLPHQGMMSPPFVIFFLRIEFRHVVSVPPERNTAAGHISVCIK